MLAAMAASGLGVPAFASCPGVTPRRVIFWRERCQLADAVAVGRQKVRSLRVADDAPHTASPPDAPLSGVTASVVMAHFAVTRTSDPAVVLLVLRAAQACEGQQPC